MINFDEFVRITDTEIHVQVFRLGAKFSNLDKELLYDLFATKYSGQQVVVTAWDGENLQQRGIFDFFESLCQHGIVPRDRILIQNHDYGFEQNFNHRPLHLSIFWNFWKECPEDVFGAVPNSAQFVGVSIGRFTPTRIRLAYELDQAFGNNAYIIFQPRLEEIKEFYAQTGSTFKKELTWLENHQFQQDGAWHEWRQTATIWEQSCRRYHNLWPCYQIEIAVESDALSNYWFTEKTARCLAAGKPFVLLAGAGSLARLRALGFQTYSEVIDEHYDNEFVPSKRIFKIIESLKQLYNCADKQQKIQKLYSIAQQNKQIYLEKHDNPAI